MSKGGGGTQTVTQEVPEWAKPFYLDLVDKAKATTEQPYQPYTGPRLAETPQDILTSREMVRGIASTPTPGVGEAMNVIGGLGEQSFLLSGQPPSSFTQAKFSETEVSPYAGFEAGEATAYTGFAPTLGEEYTGFQAGVATPYAGFSATSVSPYADFRASEFSETGVSPFAGFEERGAQEFEFAPSRQFTSEEAEKYMSPYMEAVVGRQEEEAIRQSARQRAGRAAQAIGAGAFGGSRQAVQESLAEESLGRQLGDIRASGLQTAYEQAARQFESDRAAEMSLQERRAAEAARVQGAGTSEAARVQQARAAELARTQGISVDEAARVQQAGAAEDARIQREQAAEMARVQGISVDEAARIQQSQAAELARTQGINIEEAARIQSATAAERARLQSMNAAEFARVQESQAAELARVQNISIQEAARIQKAEAEELARVQGISVDEAARVQAANASEKARVQAARAEEARFRSNFQLQTMGFSADMAMALADLGQRARAGDIQAAQLLDAQGLSMMARDQAGLDIAYQDFLRQQQYPMDQLAAYSGLLRGLPVGPAGTTTTTYPQPSPAQQLLGTGISAYGLYRGLQ